MLLFDCSTWNNALQNTGQEWLNREKKSVLDIAMDAIFPKSRARLAVRRKFGGVFVEKQKMETEDGVCKERINPDCADPA